MADRGSENPQKLFAAYLEANPNLTTRLLYNGVQILELQKSLERINSDPTVTLDNGVEIAGSAADKTGRKLVLLSDPKLRTSELRVVAPRANNLPSDIANDPAKFKDITEPYGSETDPNNPHMMRVIMIGTGNLGEGNYKAIAEATQAGEKQPWLGLWPKEGMVGAALRAARVAALYELKPQEGGKYFVTVDKPGQKPASETWIELSKKFNYGAGSYMVIGRAANVGRVPAKIV